MDFKVSSKVCSLLSHSVYASKSLLHPPTTTTTNTNTTTTTLYPNHSQALSCCLITGEAGYSSSPDAVPCEAAA